MLTADAFAGTNVLVTNVQIAVRPVNSSVIMAAMLSPEMCFYKENQKKNEENPEQARQNRVCNV